MKVKITSDTKKWLTLEQEPKAKQIIADLKQDETSTAEYLKVAANCWIRNTSASKNDDVVKVIYADAEIAGNSRVYDRYFDGSGTLDVWITGTIETYYGFLKLGAYLSDIWEIGPADFNECFPVLTYGRYFTEK